MDEEGPLQYSTHAAASSTVAPLPSTFTVIDGSAPRRTSEPDELAGTEVAGFELVVPREVDPARTGIARPDAPGPVIVLRRRFHPAIG